MKLLAGDIGGTHTRLAYVEAERGEYSILAQQDYPSQQYPDFIPLLQSFIQQYTAGASIEACCLAVAGPVKSQVVHVTNLPWIISRRQLVELLQTEKVILINDFIAVAYGVPLLEASETILLQQGRPPEDSLRPDAVVIGAGTGLGAAHLVWQGHQYQAFPSEAGHAGFAPATPLQCELLAWMQKSNSHVSLELLLSGNGFGRIYHFIRDVLHVEESGVVRQQMQQGDPAEVITRFALAKQDALCCQVLDTFIQIYGAAASDISLHYYPLDVVYIAGGIAPKLCERMQQPDFIQAFNNKGAMTDNMQNLTIRLVTEERVGQYGAIARALMLD